MELTKTEGGVCAPKGFKANGVYCGIKKPAADNQNPAVPHKNDLGMIVSDTQCVCAAVYTTNKVKGAPILVTKHNLEKTGNRAKAVIVNSKNANTCNADGVEKAEKMCALAAGELGIKPEEIIVASTGVIGQILPIEPIEKGIKPLVSGLSYTGNEAAATAIMTTDTIKKEYAVEFNAGGKTCRIGGMAKGSGMIHPNMATTLNFITTDIQISAEMLKAALDDVVKVTYNCLSIDGDTSTNDMVAVMANGLAGNAPERFGRVRSPPMLNDLGNTRSGPKSCYLLCAHGTHLLCRSLKFLRRCVTLSFFPVNSLVNRLSNATNERSISSVNGCRSSKSDKTEHTHGGARRATRRHRLPARQKSAGILECPRLSSTRRATTHLWRTS